jgi:hypothetical protein
VSEHPLTTLPTGPPGISVIEGLSTVEVRWIRPGQLDAAIAGWFRRFPAETDGFTNLATASTVLSPAGQQQVAHALETDAQILSSTQLEQQLASHPETIQNEIIRMNTDARPPALQIALLIPVLAGGLGLFNSFRMMRLPDPLPSGIAEGAALG